MATFDLDDETLYDITPEEFLEKCSVKELTETFNLLSYDYGYEQPDENKNIRSSRQDNFNYYLFFLKNNYYSIDNEDINLIEQLAKKYGSRLL